MTLYSRIARALLVIALTFVSISLAQARRMIPDDNLAYPVLIILKNKSRGDAWFWLGRLSGHGQRGIFSDRKTCHRGWSAR